MDWMNPGSLLERASSSQYCTPLHESRIRIDREAGRELSGQRGSGSVSVL